MLGNSCSQPLDSTVGGINLCEFTTEREVLTNVLHLCIDNGLACFFCTSKLKSTTSEQLQLVNTNTEVLGHEATKTGVANTSGNLTIGLRCESYPVATLWHTNRWLVEQLLRTQSHVGVILVKGDTLYKQLLL